jgi:predicted lysophospholipase L1 biosynthesis ABC-type transport system permease subunit
MMTMEIERRHTPVPGELLEYLRANPTAAQAAADGGVHVHVHHHYEAAPAVPAGAIVHQGPERTAAEKMIPWLYAALLACVVLTLCALVLATVMVIAVVVLAALVLLGLVVAHIINSHAGAVEAKAKAEALAAKGTHRRR